MTGDDAQSGRSAFDLEERTVVFGEAIVRFARKTPPNLVTAPLISPIVRSGTSVGANYCEADDAVSKKDFRHKIGTCRKESPPLDQPTPTSQSLLTSAASNLRRAVFLDRDGVINRALEREAKPYPPRNLAEFEILPEVPGALARLKAAGFLLVVATNQPDVGRGTLRRDVVETIHAHLLAQLPIDRVEVCFHPGQGESDCDCRKPKPGMLRRAALALEIDLKRSWMVGDRWRDVDCGHAAGCQTIFIDRGYAEELRQKPDFSARNLAEAADIILAHLKNI